MSEFTSKARDYPTTLNSRQYRSSDHFLEIPSIFARFSRTSVAEVQRVITNVIMIALLFSVICVVGTVNEC
jgi:hypothetical protein